MMDFICLLVELPEPFGNGALQKICKYEEDEFDDVVEKLDESSYYINHERRIIIKHRDILKILSNYRLHIYEGHPNQFHFRDVYIKLVKKAFREEDPSFKAQSHLKEKMLDDWESTFKTKHYIKSGFKGH